MLYEGRATSPSPTSRRVGSGEARQVDHFRVLQMNSCSYTQWIKCRARRDPRPAAVTRACPLPRQLRVMDVVDPYRPVLPRFATTVRDEA